MSASIEEAPPLDVRWVHLGTPFLNLLGSPISAPAQIYAAFTSSESDQMEARWQGLTPEEQFATRTKNPSLDEILKKQQKKDKDAKKKKEKDQARERHAGRSVKIEEEEVEEADEAEDKRLQLELENTRADTAEEMEKEEEFVGVPVAKDGLFEVDVKEMKLYPVYWHHRGPNIPVRRARWFFSEDKPCSELLCDELEEGFHQIKPWVSSYGEELQAALLNGKEAEAKLRYGLKQSKEDAGGSFVVYQDEGVARIISESITARLSVTIWNALRSSSSSNTGGTLVYRGFQSAVTAAHPPSSEKKESHSRSSSRSSVAPSIMNGNGGGGGHKSARTSLDITRDKMVDDLQRGVEGLAKKLTEVDEGPNGSFVEGVEKPTMMPNGEPGEPPAGEVTDLILVVHGIGQQLALTHEGFSFVYCTNLLRKEAQKQATGAALKSIMRDRQVQFLPIQWRASLKFAQNDAEAQEDLDHELDNKFTLDDITLSKNISWVREVTNNVLIDIPYFMSHHKERMIEAVATQCNKTYRLWCKRHPGFETKGRVHVIGHSLGSALVAEVLSAQATNLPSLSTLPKQVIYGSKDRFIFNTQALFLVGSPLGLFIHLHSAQLIPRAGRDRTKHSPPDEALDRAGRMGCMAVSSLYNVFHPSDPIAYMLNACVDAKKARTMEPLLISNVTAGLLSTFSDSMGRGMGSLSQIFNGLPNPFGGSGSSQLKRPETIRLPSGVELTGGVGFERLKGTRAERRFSALNPHGNIDFCLQSTGIVSEYYDLLTAHGDYWTDSSFAAFVLSEIFATKEDLVRTGMGAPLLSPGEDVLKV
ncbi:Phosphatidic acid-preferring phospholipase A1, contains DDHD domain [Phaffia rhodozyma]|uniref:Phosphatidic acid-preferring phospholipase A1, contains DDHD domain n=1 Tax=Phaffia rhodozyma TaxID=264483 RepID=A0A0F7SVG3_PHARH|nr:Phosphatidic acid-preferring phospholipase A1, contains DDHD domain [Phaffia rhodozyma]